MIEPYVDAVSRALGAVLVLLNQLALPLAIGLGLAILGHSLALAFPRDGASSRQGDWRRGGGRALGYGAVVLIAIAGWAAVSTVLPLARQELAWRESAEATANPIPDSPPVFQQGPVVSVPVERTYTRTLTLPPDFAQRLGTDAAGALEPYLTDPSARHVLKMADVFRRRGRQVVFSREVTLQDEDPVPFTRSQVRARFRRLPGSAYDLEFEGRYAFANPGAGEARVRFVFPLPNVGTVRNLKVTVGDEAIDQPDDGGACVWNGMLAAGEQREAWVRYRMLGSRSWHYDLGSRRRRVQEFRLDLDPGGPVRFMRGSLEPTASVGGSLRWQLGDVVTAQQVAMAFPADIAGRDSYLQALAALPASLVVFLLGVIAVGLRLRKLPAPGRLAAAVVAFCLGLGAAGVLAHYLGPIAGTLLGPLAGALLAAQLLGRRSLLAAVPAALLPAAFLSPDHSGLLVLLLAIGALAAFHFVTRADAPAGG